MTTEDAGQEDRGGEPEKPDFSGLAAFIKSVQEHAQKFPWQAEYCPADRCEGFYQPPGARMALRCDRYETSNCPHNARNIRAAWDSKAAQWGIPLRYRWPDAKRLFATDPAPQQRREFLEKYIASLADGGTEGLLMSGGVGTGKSFAMSYIARRLWQRDRETRLIYIHTPDLMDALHNSEEPVVDTYASAPVLMLDDVGTEYLADWNISRFSQIMEKRHKNMRPTIITTNLSPPALDRHESLARVIDRWKENCRILLLTGPSMRTQT